MKKKSEQILTNLKTSSDLPALINFDHQLMFTKPSTILDMQKSMH